ncbi:STAS domain-containing protein [Streptomyces sp. NPDC013953]|uniref:STAS domain-containing protein n=1 Tax=Streptomyces sp. NPDC013953 TaxID=3364868 RepID=UPI003702F885
MEDLQASDLQASYEHVSDYITVVTLLGLVHRYSAPALRQLLVDLVNHGRMFLVVDMTQVDFFDSTGGGVLIGALKRIRAHDGGLALVVPSERIQKFFRVNGLTKVFPMFDGGSRG